MVNTTQRQQVLAEKHCAMHMPRQRHEAPVKADMCCPLVVVLTVCPETQFAIMATSEASQGSHGTRNAYVHMNVWLAVPNHNHTRHHAWVWFALNSAETPRKA